MSKYIGNMSIYFVYISDGESSHPGTEIQKMLANKTAVINGGFEFNYASILIGASSSAPMDLINKELQGSSTFVHATHNSTDDPLKTSICFV